MRTNPEDDVKTAKDSLFGEFAVMFQDTDTRPNEPVRTKPTCSATTVHSLYTLVTVVMLTTK